MIGERLVVWRYACRRDGVRRGAGGSAKGRMLMQISREKLVGPSRPRLDSRGRAAASVRREEQHQDREDDSGAGGHCERGGKVGLRGDDHLGRRRWAGPIERAWGRRRDGRLGGIRSGASAGAGGGLRALPLCRGRSRMGVALAAAAIRWPAGAAPRGSGVGGSPHEGEGGDERERQQPCPSASHSAMVPCGARGQTGLPGLPPSKVGIGYHIS